MKVLEHYETRKGNKLIFKQKTSDIPSIGSIVLAELDLQDSGKSSKNSSQKEIGLIIDVFGPVKEPWIVVNLNKDYKFDFTKNKFYWQKFSKNKAKGNKKTKKKFQKRSQAPFRKNTQFKKKKGNKN